MYKAHLGFDSLGFSIRIFFLFFLELCSRWRFFFSILKKSLVLIVPTNDPVEKMLVGDLMSVRVCPGHFSFDHCLSSDMGIEMRSGRIRFVREFSAQLIMKLKLTVAFILISFMFLNCPNTKESKTPEEYQNNFLVDVLLFGKNQQSLSHFFWNTSNVWKKQSLDLNFCK